MRRFSAVTLFASTLLAASSVAAQDRAQVGAFGGYTFGSTTEAIFDAVDCDLYVVKLEDHEERNNKEELPAGF